MSLFARNKNKFSRRSKSASEKSYKLVLRTVGQNIISLKSEFRRENFSYDFIKKISRGPV